MPVRESTRGRIASAKPVVPCLKPTIDAQRRQLFRAGAVVNVCAIAAVDVHADRDELAVALEWVAEAIDNVAAALESVGGAS